MIENNVQKTEFNTNINLPPLSKEAEGFLCKITAPVLVAGADFLTTKFRLATFNAICEYANKIAENTGIQIQPTPPKFLLPFIEKASLEDDIELQQQWAKLLVSAGKDYNPLHIQYSEILSQISSCEAKLLKEIYQHQNRDKFGKYFLDRANNILKDYENENLMGDVADKISGGLEVGSAVDMGEGEYYFDRSNAPEIHIKVDYPDRPELDFLFMPHFDYYSQDNIDVLERIGLIKFIENEHGPFLALTPFGYNFIETLEGVSNVSA